MNKPKLKNFIFKKGLKSFLEHRKKYKILELIKDKEIQKKIFIISDNHFSHKNIIKYCNRGFNSINQMDKFMIKKWNEQVKPSDIVIHLGDFSWGNTEQIKQTRTKLNGTIILIKGSHDKKITNECNIIIINENIKIGNLILSHTPLNSAEIPIGFINIHGHIHNKKSYYGVNVSVERLDYKPIRLNKLMRNK